MRSLRKAREQDSSMCDSGRSGAGMPSAMSAIVQTARRAVFCAHTHTPYPYAMYHVLVGTRATAFLHLHARTLSSSSQLSRSRKSKSKS
jgi:hypothetical protein